MAPARPAASEGWLCFGAVLFYPIPRVKMHSISLLVRLPDKMRRYSSDCRFPSSYDFLPDALSQRT